ncbi:hypothetical protein K469DRAFT_811715 [Zopfia rhizophila CBS 207.26]|uniref:Uncharacterized protein n=1 Tax=Zopfia rhizophila CBS 207.26 TaxID=1314779 RepID=A0A6A6EG49_9PEZI|nr:hypothetical protein K469DRAFT_811715 [Zopfia rhizophila CBS 207.26]
MLAAGGAAATAPSKEPRFVRVTSISVQRQAWNREKESNKVHHLGGRDSSAINFDEGEGSNVDIAPVNDSVNSFECTPLTSTCNGRTIMICGSDGKWQATGNCKYSGCCVSAGDRAWRECGLDADHSPFPSSFLTRNIPGWAPTPWSLVTKAIDACALRKSHRLRFRFANFASDPQDRT